MNEPNVVVFARTIADRTDDEVITFVDQLPGLLSKATTNERVAHDRILHDLARRVHDLGAVVKIGCGRDRCEYAMRVGLIAGVDVSIDGDVWPNSPYAKHIERCPYRAELRGDRPILTIDVHPGADPATMAAIRRVRSFQKQADEGRLRSMSVEAWLWIITLALAAVGIPLATVTSRDPEKLPAWLDVIGLFCLSATPIVGMLALVTSTTKAL